MVFDGTLYRFCVVKHNRKICGHQIGNRRLIRNQILSYMYRTQKGIFEKKKKLLIGKHSILEFELQTSNHSRYPNGVNRSLENPDRGLKWVSSEGILIQLYFIHNYSVSAWYLCTCQKIILLLKIRILKFSVLLLTHSRFKY